MDNDCPVPLFVDLDGTLIKTDLLIEAVIQLLKLNLLYMFVLPLWLMKGKAYFKHQLATRTTIAPELLPYHTGFLQFLREEARNGREMYLATASNERHAKQVADHLGIFRGVFSSNAKNNLSGKNKLQTILATAGQRGFDYAGNAMADMMIFPHARHAILVNPVYGLKIAASRALKNVILFDERAGLKVYLKAMRPHQWIKNILVFVPIITAHVWSDLLIIENAAIAFLAFSLCASSVYLLNDMLDLPADRAHPRKRKRPFAAGDLPLTHGALMIALLILAGLTVASSVSLPFLAVTALYLVTTLAYSFILKLYVFIDVLVLASLYTLRVIAGATAISVTPSFWLLSFSMFIFLSLALIKRCAELLTLEQAGQLGAKGRDYRVADISYLKSMGTASSYVSVLVMAFYINSPEVAGLYSHPQALWMICPLILYWLSRLWIKTGRDEMHDDPIIFTLMDRGSRYVVAASAAVVLLAV